MLQSLYFENKNAPAFYLVEEPAFIDAFIKLFFNMWSREKAESMSKDSLTQWLNSIIKWLNENRDKLDM